mgnify:CR=1 FL=1
MWWFIGAWFVGCAIVACLLLLACDFGMTETDKLFDEEGIQDGHGVTASDSNHAVRDRDATHSASNEELG